MEKNSMENKTNENSFKSDITPVEPVSLVKFESEEKAANETKDDIKPNIVIEEKSEENTSTDNNSDFTKQESKPKDYSQFGNAWDQTVNRH
jgi:hypothetical protein